jgi:hypothetical protein
MHEFSTAPIVKHLLGVHLDFFGVGWGLRTC